MCSIHYILHFTVLKIIPKLDCNCSLAWCLDSNCLWLSPDLLLCHAQVTVKQVTTNRTLCATGLHLCMVQIIKIWQAQRPLLRRLLWELNYICLRLCVDSLALQCDMDMSLFNVIGRKHNQCRIMRNFGFSAQD